MTEDTQLSRTLAESIESLHASAARIWDAYQATGPGTVGNALFDGVEMNAKTCSELLQREDTVAAVGRLLNVEPEAWRERTCQSVSKSVDFARRCALRPEGLCFVTGEAGLIPRKDLHETFAAALAHLEQQCEVIRDAGG